MLKGKDLKIKGSSDKFAARNYGPFTIASQPNPLSFRLELPPQMKVHPVFHASKLIPYHEDEIGNRKPPEPGPIEVEGHDEYELERILDSRVHRGWVQYLVKWKGYDISEATWEPLTHLRDHAQEAIKDFHVEHPEAPQPTSMTNARPVLHEFNRNIYFYN